jgi:hypothetical protein
VYLLASAEQVDENHGQDQVRKPDAEAAHDVFPGCGDLRHENLSTYLMTHIYWIT